VNHGCALNGISLAGRIRLPMRHQTRRICWRVGFVPMTVVVCVLAHAATGVAQEPNGEPPPNQGLADSLWSGSSAPFVDLNQSSGWLQGLSVSGYVQTTSGMWANSSSLTNFGRFAGEHHGANSLAVERNLLQLDASYVLNGGNSWFLRFWGVYEPPYP
jgi:hypothetical protein